MSEKFDANEGFGINCAPAYTLSEQLAQRDISMLRELAAEPEIGADPEHEPETLVREISVRLATVDTLRFQLLQYTRRQLDFFREAASQRQVWRDDLNPSHYGRYASRIPIGMK